MTMQEASERYHIPLHILQEYECWGLCHGCYEEADIRRLSLILTLYDIGFSAQQVQQYMQLAVFGQETLDTRLRMLNTERIHILDEIHLLQKQLDKVDYLRFQLSQGHAKQK